MYSVFSIGLLCALLCITKQVKAQSEPEHTLGPMDMFANPSLSEEVSIVLSTYGPNYKLLQSKNLVGQERLNESTRLYSAVGNALLESDLSFIFSSIDRPIARPKTPVKTNAGSEDSTEEMIVECSLLGHRDCVALLGRLMLLGLFKNTMHQGRAMHRKYERTLALKLLARSASLGSAFSQSFLGLLYTYMDIDSEGKIVPLPQLNDTRTHESRTLAKSLLYLYMAANGGDNLANMALGYRHFYGIGVPKSCQTAILYYDAVAYRVVEQARQPGSLMRLSQGIPKKHRIGNSQASKAIHRMTGEQELHTLEGTYLFDLSGLSHIIAKFFEGSVKANKEDLNMLQYYEYKAGAGNSQAQTAMGEIFLSGSYGMPQDFQLSLDYFEQAANIGMNKEAIAHLGHMYANGLGVKQSNSTAMRYFEQAADLGSAHGMYGLGYMYLTGFTTDTDEDEGELQKPNVERALEYLKNAYEKGHIEAIYMMGVLYLNGWNTNAEHVIGRISDAIQRDEVTIVKGKDVARAYSHFQIAAYAGHPVAMYNLAMMRILGLGTQGASCSGALEMLKPLAERLSPDTKLLEFAYEETSLRADVSVLAYLLAAGAGMEVAQANAAYLLQHGANIEFDHWGSNFKKENSTNFIHRQREAIRLHKHAAEQGNMASLLAIGDIFFYGMGVEHNTEKAGDAYMQAAEIAKGTPGSSKAQILSEGRNGKSNTDPNVLLTPESAIAYAYFNLGIMHHFGTGLSKDLHLAKRFYDMANNAHSSAKGPCKVALKMLQMTMFLEEIKPKLVGYYESLFGRGKSTHHPKPGESNKGMYALKILLCTILLPLILGYALFRRPIFRAHATRDGEPQTPEVQQGIHQSENSIDNAHRENQEDTQDS